MSSVVEMLVEMGFSKTKAELAVSRTGTNDVSEAMDYLLSHDEELDTHLTQNTVTQADDNMSEVTADTQVTEASNMSIEQETTSSSEPPQPEVSEGGETPQGSEIPQVARSIKCEECGKLFTSQLEVEFHATKSGHGKFSESTEEKKPLTEEEKKEQLAKIEAKLKQRRLEREAREKQEALDKEKIRIRSGKDMLEAKKKHEEQEMKKLIEQRRREKEEEKQARQRVREQIEQDKLARKAKFGGGQPVEPQPAPAPVSQTTASPKPAGQYEEVKLQIRLTDGSALTQTFKPKEPLSAVRLFVEMNRKDGDGPFNLMMTFPRKVFASEDYDKPLDSLGLAPSAVLIVSRS